MFNMYICTVYAYGECVFTVFVSVQIVLTMEHEISFYVWKPNVIVCMCACIFVDTPAPVSAPDVDAVQSDWESVFGILWLWNDILWKNSGRIKQQKQIKEEQKN